MRRLSNDAQHDLQLRSLVEDLCRRVWPHDYVSEYAAMLNWVRKNIRYMRDPITIEQVKSPRAVLAERAADCDDVATLLAAMVGAAGGRSRFVAAAFKTGPDGQPVMAHVWCEAFDPVSNAWVALDPVPGKRVPTMLGKVVHRIVADAVG